MSNCCLQEIVDIDPKSQPAKDGIKPPNPNCSIGEYLWSPIRSYGFKEIKLLYNNIYEMWLNFSKLHLQ